MYLFCSFAAINTKSYGKKVRFPRYRLRACRYEFCAESGAQGDSSPYLQGRSGRSKYLFAQGGIASVTNLAVDNFEKHIEDTMIAGDWISDREAVEKVVRNAPEQIKELINGE